MYFLFVFLIGFVIPLLFKKAKMKWAKWFPAILLFVGMIIMGGKAKFFPGPEMAVLGEIMYFMILGTAAIGAIIGALFVHFSNKKN